MRINKIYFGLAGVLGILIFLGACGKMKMPLERLKEQLAKEKEYAIVLNDMNEEGNFFKEYYHQYRVDIGEKTVNHPYQRVDEQTFKKFEPYLGMVIASKNADGELNDTPFPNGYQYVGIPQYGRWRDDGRGGNFWEFYGKYMLLSQALRWAGLGLNRNHYNSYLGAQRSRQPFFGPKREYGTAGSVTQKQKPNFYARKMAKKSASGGRFQDKINRRIGRSKNTFRSRGFSFGK